MKISVSSFSGIAPRISPALLPPNGGQVATNARLNSGALRPINASSVEPGALTAGATSLYILGPTGTSVPLSWVADVDVAASPVADSEFRVYYTGDGLPKKTNLALASSGSPHPATWYFWGTPAPTVTPTVAISGVGSVPAGTYVYLFTNVTQFGTALLEESAPSPVASPITVSGAQGVLISGMTSPSGTNRNYVFKRIYRASSTAYQMVAQVSAATTSYTDTLSATGIAGDSLITSGWIPPPDDLMGVQSLPSGGMVGFRNNEVWFSEPNYPHAWPAKYMQPVDAPIVGLEVYGNTVVVGTRGFPFSGSGVHPDSFTFSKLPMLEPCLGKRTMTSDEYGVLYASANGLVSIGDAGSGVVSAKFVSRETLAVYAPTTFNAVLFEGRYYGFFDSPTLGRGAFVFARNEESPASTIDVPAQAATVDRQTARMLLINPVTGALNAYDPTEGVPLSYNWKSKLFLTNGPVSLGCFKVSAPDLTSSDASAGRAALNAAIVAANAALLVSTTSGAQKFELNASVLNELELNGSTLTNQIPGASDVVGVTVWRGKTPILSGNFAVNQVHRLPSGGLSNNWEVALNGQREVNAVEIATSPQELRGG